MYLRAKMHKSLICSFILLFLISTTALFAGADGNALPVQDESVINELPPLPVIPLISSATRMPYFADFDGFDQDRPCDRKAWTMKGVPWKMSEEDSAAAAEPDSEATNPEPSFSNLAFNLRTYNNMVQTAMEIIRGIYGELSPEEAKKYELLWAPFFDFPTLEANDYFQKATPLLTEYLEVSGKIDTTYQLYQNCYQDAAISAGFEDETESCANLEIMYSYAYQLKTLQEKLAGLVKQFQDLGDPPNPLKAKCRARKRHAPSEKKNLLRISWEGWETSFPRSKQDRIHNYSVGIWRGSGQVRWKINNFWDPGKGRARPKVWQAFLDPSAKDWLAFDPAFNNEKDGKITLSSVGNWAILLYPKSVFKQYQSVDSEPSKFYDEKTEDHYAIGTIGAASYSAKVGAALLLQKPRSKYANFDYAVDIGDENYCVFIKANFPTVTDDFVLTDIFVPHEKMSDNKANFLRFLKCVKFEWVNDIPAGEEDFGYCDPSLDAPPVESEEAKLAKAEKEKLEKEGAAKSSAVMAALNESLAVSTAIIEQYEKAITKVQSELSGITSDDQMQKDRIKALKNEIESYQNSIESEKFYMQTLKTGKAFCQRSSFSARSSEKIIAQIRKELGEYDEDWKVIKNLPKYYDMLDDNAYKDRWKQLNAAITDPNAHQKLKDLSGEVRKDLAVQQNKGLEFEKGKVRQAEWELAGVEAIQTATQLVLIVGSMGNPAIGYVVMGQGIAHGLIVEGSPTKALENGLRGYSSKIDIAWATVQGAFETEMVKDDNGKEVERPKGLKGAAEGFAVSYITNTIMDSIGDSIQGGLKKPFTPQAGKKAPEFANFKSSKERLDADLVKIKSNREASIPKNADGSHNTSHPDYAKQKKDYDSAVNEVLKQHEIQVKRDEMNKELGAHLEKFEKNLSPELKNPDGTMKTDSPEFQKVNREMQAGMNAIRAKYKPSNEKRMENVNDALKLASMNVDKHFTGGVPDNVSGDIDISPDTMEQGLKFVNSLKIGKGKPDVVDLNDRWVITNYDITVWKPQTRKVKIGSAEQTAEVELSFQYGSDKFGTFRKDKTGQQDPYGNVLDNAKKMVDACVQPGGPDLHVIGKSVNKALQTHANTVELDVDPVFLAKTKALREHKTPEEAGIVNFGDHPTVKKEKIEQFIQESRKVMAKALGQRKIDSDNLKLARKKNLDWLIASGKSREALELRADIASTQTCNDAALRALSKRDPKLFEAIQRKSPEVSPAEGGFGYTWIIKDVNSSSDKEPEPTTPAMIELAKQFKAANEKIGGQILPGIDPKSRDFKHYQNLQAASGEGAANPIQGAQKIRMLTGFPPGQVLKEIQER